MPLTPADVHNVAFSKPPIGKAVHKSKTTAVRSIYIGKAGKFDFREIATQIRYDVRKGEKKLPSISKFFGPLRTALGLNASQIATYRPVTRSGFCVITQHQQVTSSHLSQCPLLCRRWDGSAWTGGY